MEDQCAVPRVSLQSNFGPTALPSDPCAGRSPTQRHPPSLLPLHTCPRLLSRGSGQYYRDNGTSRRQMRQRETKNGPADQNPRPTQKPTDASRLTGNGFNDEAPQHAAPAARLTTAQQQQQPQEMSAPRGASASAVVTPSLQAIIEKQQQIIAGQAEMIEALGRELSHRAEELARGAVIREELDRLVRMTETAEEEAGRQVTALEGEVVRLSELLDARRGGENGHP